VDSKLLRDAYRNYFLKSEPGRYFMEQLDKQLDDNHRAAENDPELARDYVQRAKGIREIQVHIESVSAERRLPKG
jgi:hypothetical protein